jgi:preprotein translocase subunit SecG
MAFFIGLLTFVLVLDCAALILLVLMQLPKKDAGAGLAFGGGATDALFGAGPGNVLTKATKYAATIFFVLALVIGILQSNYHQRSVTALMEATAGAPAATPAPAAAPSAPVGTPLLLPDATNFTLDTAPPAEPPQDTVTNALPAE